MKARIVLTDRVTSKQKQAVKEYNRLEQKNIMRRYFKLLCYVLNENFGFGKSRILKVISQIEEASRLHSEDEEFWYHLDKRVIEQIGLKFEREEYKE